MDRLDRMLALVRSHRPGLRLLHKADVRWMRWAGRLLRPISPDFDRAVTTVVGDTVYLPLPPERFDRDQLARLLAHELVHQLDQRSHGVKFYLTYLLTPLPFGRTHRARWERRAYAVDLMLAFEEGGEAGLLRAMHRIVGLFAGPSYGWMWGGRGAARDFLLPTVEAIRTGRLQGEWPYREILAAWRGRPVPMPREAAGGRSEEPG